jgi:hypothetical protein
MGSWESFLAGEADGAPSFTSIPTYVRLHGDMFTSRENFTLCHTPTKLLFKMNGKKSHFSRIVDKIASELI